MLLGLTGSVCVAIGRGLDLSNTQITSIGAGVLPSGLT